MRTLALSLLLLLGCSRGAPDDVLLLQGDANPGDEVILERRLSVSCYFQIHSQLPVEPFEELARTTADAAGRYTFELYRAQTTAGDRACFRVTSASHPRTELRTQFFDWDVELPSLRSWDELPQSTAEGWTIQQVPELPQGSLSTYRAVEWQLTGPGGTLWRADAPAPFILFPDVFEDFGPATLQASARAQFLDYDDSLGVFWATYSEADVSLRTPGVELQPAAGAAIPLSRGARCLADDVELSSCVLTDGDLSRQPLAPELEIAYDLELRWDEARPLRALVIRGLEGGMEVQVQVAEGEGEWQLAATLRAPVLDGDDWGSEALKTPGFWEVVPLNGLRGNRVRLHSSVAGAFLTARELSVFE